MDLHMRDIGPLRLAAIVNRDKPVSFGAPWNEMLPLMKERGMTGPAFQSLAAFSARDLSGPATIEWYAAGVGVDDNTPITAPMEELLVPSGRYATVTFVGPIDALAQAWGDQVMRFGAAGHAFDASRPLLEIYRDDGSKTQDKQPRTELCIPISG